MKVTGVAPHDVTYVLGTAPGRPPHLRVEGRRIVGGVAAETAA